MKSGSESEKIFPDSVYLPAFYFMGGAVGNPYQYVCLQRDCKPGIGSAEASGGIAPDVIESLPAVYMDLQYMEGMRLGRIIYMAALTGIDPQLYEAASIDGANRFQKMRFITWPGILGIVCTMLILQIGGIMGGASFDQIFNLYSSPVYPVQILSTPMYSASPSRWGPTLAILRPLAC